MTYFKIRISVANKKALNAWHRPMNNVLAWSMFNPYLSLKKCQYPALAFPFRVLSSFWFGITKGDDVQPQM